MSEGKAYVARVHYDPNLPQKESLKDGAKFEPMFRAIKTRGFRLDDSVGTRVENKFNL